jgi:hypothetical protein
MKIFYYTFAKLTTIVPASHTKPKASYNTSYYRSWNCSNKPCPGARPSSNDLRFAHCLYVPHGTCVKRLCIASSKIDIVEEH